MKILIFCALVTVASAANRVCATETYSSLRVSSPFIVSGAYGLRLGDNQGQMRPSIEGEVGIGGGRLAVGLGNTGDRTLGYGIKAALIRTWLEPITVDEEQTFLGVEGRWASNDSSSTSAGTAESARVTMIG